VKLQFKVSDIGSTFLLVDALSDWDAHTKRHLASWYKRSAGELSPEEQLLLGEYKEVRKRYGWKMIPTLFITNDTFDEIREKSRKEKWQKEGDLERLLKAIEHFHPLVHNKGGIFYPLKAHLENRKKSIEDLYQKLRPEEMFNDMVKFYKSAAMPKSATVYLLYNDPDGIFTGGGHTLDERGNARIFILTYQLGKKGEYPLKVDLDESCHEIGHKIEEQTQPTEGAQTENWRRYEQRIKEERINDDSIISESVMDSLTPGGILSAKYLHKDFSALEEKLEKYRRLKVVPLEKDGKEHLMTMRRKLSAHLHPLVKSHLENGLSIYDGDLLQKAVDAYLGIKANHPDYRK
jgi:hypothetical protein